MKLRYTISVEMDVPANDEYDYVTAEDALAAGVKLPVNTPAKKAAIDKLFIENGELSVNDIIGSGECVTVTIEAVDDDMTEAPA